MNRITTTFATAAIAGLALACGDDGTSAGDYNPTGPDGNLDLVTAEIGVEAICNAITPEQKEWFGIDRVEWKSSADRIPFPHCEILSSIAKSGAVFSTGNKLTDFNQNIPTAAISRIACKPTTRVAHAVIFAGGSGDWTSALGSNGFRRFGPPGSECIAGTTVKHPSGTILESIDAFDTRYSAPNGGWDFVTGQHAITQNASAMMESLFFDEMGVAEDQRLTACWGVSEGAYLGFELLDHWMGVACDGMLLSGGADGYFPVSELVRTACFGDRIAPLTGQPVGWSCQAQHLANVIGLFDKRFREEVLQVLATEGETAAQQLIQAYDIAAAPQSAQNIAQRLTATGALIRPTIVVKGATENLVILPLRYMEKVLANRREELVRFYLVGGLGHEETINFTSLAAARLLINWMLGVEPRELIFAVPGLGTMTVRNSKDAGFETDPCGYFDFTVGSSACRNSGLFSTPH